MAYLKVDGYPNLRKDKVTGVIHNINKKEIESNKRKKAKSREQEKDIDDLKNEVSEIKTMLNKILEKL